MNFPMQGIWKGHGLIKPYGCAPIDFEAFWETIPQGDSILMIQRILLTPLFILRTNQLLFELEATQALFKVHLKNDELEAKGTGAYNRTRLDWHYTEPLLGQETYCYHPKENKWKQNAYYGDPEGYGTSIEALLHPMSTCAPDS